jgi:uncharacterized membrane protein
MLESMGRLWQILPWLVLGSGALQVMAAYPTFPARWAIHWNAAGQANGFSDKTPLGAAFPLLLGATVALILELTALWSGTRRNSDLPGDWPRRLAQATQSYVRITSAGTSILFSYLAVRLPHGQPSMLAPLLLVGVGILFPVIDSLKLYGEMRRQGVLPPGYHGIYYSNPTDPRLWVPKLGGAGWTINFGHPRGWIWMLVLLALPALGLLTALAVHLLRA